MVIKLSELNSSREEFTSPKVGFITSTFNISISTFYVGLGTFQTFKFDVGCLGSDDNIYYGPIDYTTPYILKLDTKTGIAVSFTEISNVNVTVGSTLYISGAQFGGLVCGKDGNLYSIPLNERYVSKIDPITGTRTLFSENFKGHQDYPDSNDPNWSTYNSKWYGACLAPNGKIYGIPYGYTKVLSVNPQTGTASTTEVSGTFSTGLKWIGGVLGPDGNIYGIPYFSTTVLKINPVTNTTTTFGSVSGGWVGGCLAPNGKIYAVPYYSGSSRSILKIDPIAGTATTFGSISTATFTQNSGWNGACLAPNGKIYSAPYGGTGILEINPENDTVSVIGIGSLPPLGQYTNTGARWGPFILSPDGKMYAPPQSETKILVFGETSIQEPADWLLSPYQNKGY